MFLNAKHIVSCCRKMSWEINARHDTVLNILLNNVLVQRGLVTREQRWEDRKAVRTPRDEITVGTEHQRLDEWKGKGRELPEPGSSLTLCGSGTTQGFNGEKLSLM